MNRKQNSERKLPQTTADSKTLADADLGGVNGGSRSRHRKWYDWSCWN